MFLRQTSILSKLSMLTTLLLMLAPTHLLAKSKLTPMSLGELEQLQESMSQTTQISVDFDMVQFKALRGQKTFKVGNAEFAKPKFFYWKVNTAPALQLVYNGKEFVRYSAQDTTAQVSRVNASGFQQVERLVDMVLDLKTLLKNYKILSKNWAGNMAILELSPLEKGTQIRKVKLRISKQFKFVREVKLDFTNDNYTQIKFKNLKRKKFDKTVFNFVPPKGVKLSYIQ